MDEEFKTELEVFIPSLFEEENLVNKRINGHDVTCGELFELFKVSGYK